MTDDRLIKKITEYLAVTKAKNPSFSLRAFCKRTGVSSGALSLFMNGKRTLSTEGYEKLITHLYEDPEERKNLLADINDRLLVKLRTGHVPRSVRALTKEEFRHFREWYAFAFLALVRTKDFQFDIFWISKRLEISPSTVEALIELCLRLNLLRIDSTNMVHRTDENLRTPDNLLDDKDFEADILYHHQQFIQQSLNSTVSVPRDLRDITSVTLPANPKKLEKARELIRKFQDDVMGLMEDGEETEVFRLCIQLYPVTKKL